MPEFVLLAMVFLLALAAYYSFVTYPRQRDFQKRQKFVRTLKEGDEVITFGGVIGKVLEIRADEGIAYVEIAKGVVVRIVTASLLQTFDPQELAKNAQMGAKRQMPQGE